MQLCQSFILLAPNPQHKRPFTRTFPYKYRLGSRNKIQRLSITTENMRTYELHINPYGTSLLQSSVKYYICELSKGQRRVNISGFLQHTWRWTVYCTLREPKNCEQMGCCQRIGYYATVLTYFRAWLILPEFSDSWLRNLDFRGFGPSAVRS